MLVFHRLPVSGISAAALALVSTMTVLSAPAVGQTIENPKFRAGLWRFDRTMEYPDHRVVVRREETTRCVDPTKAMRGIFSSPDIGNCRSSQPEQVENRYTFANRCDYLGPVRTQITVHGDDAYTELHQLRSGDFPKVDKVVAERIGDCDVPGLEVSSRDKAKRD